MQFQSTPPVRGATKKELFDQLNLHGFQSAPPARGATDTFLVDNIMTAISIRAPREGGDDEGLEKYIAEIISIRAPREGGDLVPRGKPATVSVFQSAPPARGATESRNQH